MRRLAAGVFFSLMVMLPSCCTYNNIKHPEPKLTLAQHLEKKTVALDHWLGVVGHDKDDDPIIDEVDPAKVKDAELRAYCTGIWVNHDTILTAAHCVEVHKPQLYKIIESFGLPLPVGAPAWSAVGDKLQYSTYDDIQDAPLKKVRTTRNCTVFAVDKEDDLAVIKVDTNQLGDLANHEVAVIASSIQVGDDIHIMGHPGGVLWTYARGSVARIRDAYPNADENKVDTLQISAPVWYGDSGGGAFDSNGHLVGVMSFINNRIPNVGFCVKFNVIERFLTHYKIKHTSR